MLAVRERPAKVTNIGTLSTTFACELIEGRDYSVRKIIPPSPEPGGRGQSWSAHIANREIDTGEGFTADDIIFNFPETRHQGNEIEPIASFAAEFLHRWSQVIDERLERRLRYVVIDAATQVVSSDGKRFFPNLRYSKQKRDYAIDLTVVNPQTNKASKITESAAFAHITNSDVRSVPDNCVFIQEYRRKDSPFALDSTAVPEAVTGEERVRHQAAEDFKKFIAWKFPGKVIEYVHLRQSVSDYREMFASNPRGQS